MNICKRTIIMAAGAAVAALAVAAPASASTATQSVRSFIFPVKATTARRTQRHPVGPPHPHRHVSGGVPVLPFHCGPSASRCFGYSAVVKDTGISGASSPAGWSYSFAFFAVASWPKLFFRQPAPGREHHRLLAARKPR